MYVDAQMRALMVEGALSKIAWPSQRREMAKVAVAQHGVVIGLACTAFGICETCYPYQAKRQAENKEIANSLGQLTDNNRN